MGTKGSKSTSKQTETTELKRPIDTRFLRAKIQEKEFKARYEQAKREYEEREEQKRQKCLAEEAFLNTWLTENVSEETQAVDVDEVVNTLINSVNLNADLGNYRIVVFPQIFRKISEHFNCGEFNNIGAKGCGAVLRIMIDHISTILEEFARRSLKHICKPRCRIVTNHYYVYDSYNHYNFITSLELEVLIEPQSK